MRVITLITFKLYKNVSHKSIDIDLFYHLSLYETAEKNSNKIHLLLLYILLLIYFSYQRFL